MTAEPKRIVIFGINYSPEMTGIGPYTAELAEHFAELGHQVDVITGIPHYPEWRPMPFSSENAATGIAVHRYKHFIPKRPNALARMIYEVTWLFSASRALFRGKYDAAFGVVPSLSGGLLAVLASRRWRIPIGLIVKDLMGPAAAQSGYRGGAFVASMTRRAEQSIARRADIVAIISDGFRPYLRDSGVATERIRRVRDWTHPGKPTESAQECRQRMGWADDDFICLHAGNMGQKQGLDNVLDAAVLLRESRVAFVLAGDGNDRRRLVERARTLSANVSFVDLQPPGRYEAMLRAADVQILNQRASVGEMSLPSKLASYFAAGRPVVAAVARMSPAGREVEDARAGIVVEPDQPRALAEALLFLESNRSVAEELGSNGKLYAEDNLSPQSALATYDELLRDLIEDRLSVSQSYGRRQSQRLQEAGERDRLH